jgi:hypothetical protein
MKYKLIQNSSNIENFRYEVELTEEQYLEYLQNPDNFLTYNEEDLNWVNIPVDSTIGPTTFTSSIS